MPKLAWSDVASSVARVRLPPSSLTGAEIRADLLASGAIRSARPASPLPACPHPIDAAGIVAAARAILSTHQPEDLPSIIENAEPRLAACLRAALQNEARPS